MLLYPLPCSALLFRFVKNAEKLTNQESIANVNKKPPQQETCWNYWLSKIFLLNQYLKKVERLKFCVGCAGFESGFEGRDSKQRQVPYDPNHSIKVRTLQYFCVDFLLEFSISC